MANQKCMFCGENMRLGTRSMGPGMNLVTFFCDSCGAVSIFAHEELKKITEFDIDFKSEPMLPGVPAKKKVYTRLDASREAFPGEIRSQIPEDHCPYEMDNSLDNIDIHTYRFSEYEGDDSKGCRGITCDECWAKEYNPTAED